MGSQGHQHAAAVMNTAISIMAIATSVAFFGCLSLLPILCIFRPSRRFAGGAYLVSSYVFGAVLWIMSALTVYAAWGGFAVFVGVMVLGIGVVPMAIWILVSDAQWLSVANIALLGGSLVGSRLLGAWIIARQNLIR